MSSVSFHKLYQHAEYAFRVISLSIHENRSARISSNSPRTAALLLDHLLGDYPTRKRFLGRQKDSLCYINLTLTDESDMTQLDTLVISLFSEQLGHSFSNVHEVGKYISDHDLTGVVILHNIPDSLMRAVLSYSFLFQNRLLFFDISQRNDHTYFPDQIDAMLPVSVVSDFVAENLEYYEVGGVLDTTQILDAVTHDPASIDRTIIQHLMMLNKQLTIKPVRRESEDGEKTVYHSEKTHSVIRNVVREQMPLVHKSTGPATNESKPKVAVQLPVSGSNLPQSSVSAELGKVDLSAREEAIFSVLQSKQFISRDEIASVVWGEGAQVSDDAIDQVISRLRRKFVQAGYPKSYITSKKGEGVLLGAL
jgi:hypothetical protein